MNKVYITKYWRISRLLKEYPISAEVLIENEIPCTGCDGASAERLGEGLATHGLNESEIESIINEINQEIQVSERKSLQSKIQEFSNLPVDVKESGAKIGGIFITKSAIDSFKQFNEQNQIVVIRLEAGGCSGYNYEYNFKDAMLEDEVLFEIDGLKVAFSIFTMENAKELMIDFKLGLKDSGFKFENKRAKKSCSCGKSMSI